MDEPVRSRLRAARRSGLTSPDRSPHPHSPSSCPAAARQPRTPQQPLDKPQECKRQETHARTDPKIRFTGPCTQKRPHEFTRWIEA